MTRTPRQDPGTAATARIVAHPATQQVVPVLRALLAHQRIRWDSPDTETTAAMLRRIFGLAGEADGVKDKNPFDPDGGLWPDPDDRAEVIDHARRVGLMLAEAAAHLAAAGAPIVPAWPGDLVALGLLVLGPIDLTAPAGTIIKEISPIPLWASSRDGLTVVRRPGLTAQAVRDAGDYGRAIEIRRREAAGLPRPAQNYPANRRTSPEITTRRAALAAVIKKWPEVDASAFRLEGNRLSPQAARLEKERTARGLPKRLKYEYGTGPAGLRTRGEIGDDLRILRPDRHA
ncbi:hypothetical protein [Frankia sp. CiP1_Cm_nod2]|uniref:hypothetical protein n=1 Tax=Frankia sp. CiP1_Cm_nod2 TaxID=2897161 RepID=UPI0020257A75